MSLCNPALAAASAEDGGSCECSGVAGRLLAAAAPAAKPPPPSSGGPPGEKPPGCCGPRLRRVAEETGEASEAPQLAWDWLASDEPVRTSWVPAAAPPPAQSRRRGEGCGAPRHTRHDVRELTAALEEKGHY